MSVNFTCTAEEALKKLKDGNARYLSAKENEGDISLALREKTCAEGQKPYAIIVTCSDSRVIPESIFSAGIGELFVIRVAGNVIDNHQLGSVEYAAGHLGSPLVVVMGHNHCGAVGAAISDDPSGFIKFITDEIKKAIGGETDDYKACCLNVQNSVKAIESSLKIKQGEGNGLQVCGALYHLEDGRVEFL
ncbi:MAG: carbonic anhydrase [Acetatifactor sp.]|nr:carbonic anhydrase [Acetatifactor sp.]